MPTCKQCDDCQKDFEILSAMHKRVLSKLDKARQLALDADAYRKTSHELGTTGLGFEKSLDEFLKCLEFKVNHASQASTQSGEK